MSYLVVGDCSENWATLTLSLIGTSHEQREAWVRLMGLTPLVHDGETGKAVTDVTTVLTMPLTWPALVQVRMRVSDRLIPSERLARWEDHQRTIRSAVGDPTGLLEPPEPLWYQPPDGMVPRPYQVAGAQLIRWTGRVMLNDEAGVGKTPAAILGLVERHHFEPFAGPVVIAAPNSVVDNWHHEWSMWAPHCPVRVWRGTPAQRSRLVSRYSGDGFMVYIGSYDTIARDMNNAKRELPRLMGPISALVCDESHLLKNSQAARTVAITKLAKDIPNVVFMTGTPLAHGPDDVYPTIKIVEQGAYPSKERWVERYAIYTQGDYSATVHGLNPDTRPEFNLSMLGRKRRLAKVDVLPFLPPKSYSTRIIPLPADAQKAYDAMKDNMLAEVQEGKNLAAFGTLAQLTRLLQLSCSSCDVEEYEEWVKQRDGEEVLTTKYNVTMIEPSWKIDALMEELDSRRGSSSVVFSAGPTRALLELAVKRARKEGFRASVLVGGMSAAQRTENVRAFQAGETDVFFATTGAGGVGITLTAANAVIFLQRPWSLIEASQAEDRAHRIGSEIHHKIDVVDIVAAGTVDFHIRERLVLKGENMSDYLEDPRIIEGLLGGWDARCDAELESAKLRHGKVSDETAQLYA